MTIKDWKLIREALPEIYEWIIKVHKEWKKNNGHKT